MLQPSQTGADLIPNLFPNGRSTHLLRLDVEPSHSTLMHTTVPQIVIYSTNRAGTMRSAAAGAGTASRQPAQKPFGLASGLRLRDSTNADKSF